MLGLVGCGSDGPTPMPEDLDLSRLIPYVCDDGDREICVVSADGTWTKQLTENNTPDYAPSINSTGQIAYSCKESNPDDEEICVINIDGTDRRQLTDNEFQDSFPIINELAQILYVCETEETKEEFPDQHVRHLCGVQFDGSDEHQITVQDHGNPSIPVMNNLGEIAFPCWNDQGRQICMINFDGTDLATLTDEAFTYKANSINDSGKIACSFFDQQDNEICSINADGTGYRQLTRNNGQDLSADVSRLGRFVYACVANEGRSGICIVNGNGTGQLQLATDAEEALEPYFVSEDLVAFICRTEEEELALEVCVVKITGAGFEVLTGDRYNPF